MEKCTVTVVFFTEDGKSIFYDGDIAHSFTQSKKLWEYIDKVIKEVKEAAQFKIFQPDDPVATEEYWDIDRDIQRG